jgi:hypothetical protein
MALISCSECSKQISDLAPSCPHCGAPLRPAPAPARPKNDRAKLIGAGGAVVLFVLGMAILSRGSSSREKDNAPVASTAEALRAPAPVSGRYCYADNKKVCLDIDFEALTATATERGPDGRRGADQLSRGSGEVDYLGPANSRGARVELKLLADNQVGLRISDAKDRGFPRLERTGPIPPEPKLPPEPPPDPELIKLADLPKWEAKLASDGAYAGILEPKRRDDFKLLLTGVSELVAYSGFDLPVYIALKRRKILEEPSVALYMIWLRIGAFPEDFTAALRKLLDDTKGDPRLGVWSPAEKGHDPHDFSALAAWVNRDRPEYIRQFITARASLGWQAYDAAKNGPPRRPYLTYEVEALKWLALLVPLTADEQAQLQRATLDASTLRVPIETLLGEYRSNEVRADSKFKGKLVQVAGVVGDVKKDLLNSVYVTLGTGAPFEIPEVQCFVQDASTVASLSKGDRVTMRGRVDGLMMNVLVRDCEVVR